MAREHMLPWERDINLVSAGLEIKLEVAGCKSQEGSGEPCCRVWILSTGNGTIIKN